MGNEKKYKVLKGYTFFAGEGRDAKVYKPGDTFLESQVKPTEISTQSWKVEVISGKETKENPNTNNNAGKLDSEDKSIMAKPPNNRAVKSANNR